MPIESPQRKVISASRRVDLVACYPKQLIATLLKKCPPERVHTLVLWTKNARPLLTNNKLRSCLVGYDQIYLEYSITGMGGSILEPQVPKTDVALSHLPELIQLVGGPERILIRFDPIVHVQLPDGTLYSNLSVFPDLAERLRHLGLSAVTTSWMQRYAKVDARLQRHGVIPMEWADTWEAEAKWLQSVARANSLQLQGCCVPGWPTGACIDGERLNRLHPRGYRCSTARAKGQRKLCGCTESWDIGWYWPCYLGCIYCYANPAESPQEDRPE